MNEDELRAALRAGEGDRPDPAHVVAAARARRTRLGAVAASTVVVVAVAVTAGVLAGSRGGGDRPTGGGPTVPGLVAPACPTSFPGSVVTPGVRGSGSPLPAAADAVLVCAYGSTGTTGAPARLTLTGTDARRLVQSMDDAPATRPHIMCPDYRRAEDHRLSFVGLTGGRASAPASTTLGDATCSVVLTYDGGARYGWSPPQDLLARLLTLHP